MRSLPSSYRISSCHLLTSPSWAEDRHASFPHFPGERMFPRCRVRSWSAEEEMRSSKAHPQLQEATGSGVSYIPFSLIPWLRDIEFHQPLPICVTREGVWSRRKRSLCLDSADIRCDSETSAQFKKGVLTKVAFSSSSPDDFCQPSALLLCPSSTRIKVMISINIKRSRGTTSAIFLKLGWKTHRDGVCGWGWVICSREQVQQMASPLLCPTERAGLRGAQDLLYMWGLYSLIK